MCCMVDNAYCDPDEEDFASTWSMCWAEMERPWKGSTPAIPAIEPVDCLPPVYFAEWEVIDGCPAING